MTGDSLPPAVRAASPPANIWQATLPLATLPGLRIDSQRLTRARFPNADPERDGFMPPNVFRANWTAQPVTPLPEKQVDLPPTVLLRNTTKTMFQTFTAGLGGTCERFEPAAGYWCSTAVQGGGSTIYQVPIAMQVGVETLPHLPYAHPKGAIVQTWRPGHWVSRCGRIQSLSWACLLRSFESSLSVWPLSPVRPVRPACWQCMVCLGWEFIAIIHTVRHD